ncbi:hypothetical protein HK101_009792 [Irineochytrium annulatum]|nr:hypothetical protein HK101_009792 [Irineochytrium annulatum]
MPGPNHFHSIHEPIVVQLSSVIDDSESFGIFPSLLSEAARSVRDKGSRYFKATGFEFCTMLNNATFDSLTHVHRWGMSVAEYNPPMEVFTGMLDEEARATRDQIAMDNQFLEREELKRFSCHVVAEGNNVPANLTHSRLLHHVDAESYMTPVLPALHHMPLRTPTRRTYRIAYVLMIHGGVESLDAAKLLVHELDDGSAVFLVHVDGGSERLAEATESWVEERNQRLHEQRLARSKGTEITREPGNVFLARYRYTGMWGHVSLVWMQVSGFWELLDLADWDLVINLSAHDFPLRRSREVHRVLSVGFDPHGTAEKNYVGFWVGSWEGEAHLDTAKRMTLPMLAREEQASYENTLHSPKNLGLLYPPFRNWQMAKHSQWVILSRKFVEHLRTSNEALDALAHMEFTQIPDEQYFGTGTVPAFLARSHHYFPPVLLNAPEFQHTLINDHKRFIHFYPGHAHPATLDIGWRSAIGEQEPGQDPKYLFVRKVRSETPEGGELIAWVRENHLDRHVLPDERYGDIPGKEYVLRDW